VPEGGGEGGGTPLQPSNTLPRDYTAKVPEAKKLVCITVKLDFFLAIKQYIL